MVGADPETSPPRSWRERARGQALREYADPLATLLAALIFAFLAGFGVVKQELLAGVTLGVLAAVTAVMFRQRYVIEQVKTSLDLIPDRLDRVGAAVEKVERTVEAVTSSDVYEILDHEAEWEIATRDGSLAYGQKRKKLRFNQQDVVSIYELTQVSGGRPGTVGEWAFEPEAIENMGTISIDGDNYILLSLGARYRRGDELEYTSRRVIRDLFTDDQNRVSHRVRERTSHLRLRVVWPEDGGPRRVKIEELAPDRKGKTEELAGGELMLDEGKPFVERSYEHPPRDHKVVITWWLGQDP
jgi:hypothetical protein